MGFEVSPFSTSCSSAQNPFEVKHGIARPKGTQPLLESSFLPRAGSARTFVISDGCFRAFSIPLCLLLFFLLLLFSPSSHFFPPSQYMLLFNSFLRNLISFPPNCFSLGYAQPGLFRIHLFVLGGLELRGNTGQRRLVAELHNSPQLIYLAVASKWHSLIFESNRKHYIL